MPRNIGVTCGIYIACLNSLDPFLVLKDCNNCMRLLIRSKLKHIKTIMYFGKLLINKDQFVIEHLLPRQGFPQPDLPPA